MNPLNLTIHLTITTILLCCATISSSGDSDEQKLDCAPDVTKRDQENLRIHYPSLYTDFINNEEFGDSDRGPGMKPGSVIFINAQDEHLYLNCPCNGSEYSWIMYERPDLAKYDPDQQLSEMKLDKPEKDEEEAFDTSIKFNEKEYNTQKIRSNVPSPSWRKYFNTFKCLTPTQQHYFNVFTRPLPATTFPVRWIEGVYNEDLSFDCGIFNYRNDIFQQDPYTFSWKLPPSASNNITIINIDEDNPEFIYNGFNFTYDNSTTPPSSKVFIIGNEVFVNMSGIYECIITDKNDLSSSFGGAMVLDNYTNGIKYNKTSEEGFCCQTPPEKRFYGFVHVHVREWWRVWVPFGIILFELILLVLMVKICPKKEKKVLKID